MHLSLRRNTGVEDARHRCATLGPSRDEGRNPVTGVAVKGKDRAGGKQAEQAHGWFRLDDDPVVTVGDTVEPHGTHTPAPTMVEGEEWFRVGGRPSAVRKIRQAAATQQPAGSGSASPAPTMDI